MNFLKILGRMQRVANVMMFIIVLLGAWFVSIIVKDMGPQMAAESVRTKWITNQHKTELGTNVYKSNMFSNIDGIKYTIINKTEKDGFLILDINIDSTKFSYKTKDQDIINDRISIADLACDIVPGNISYKEKEFMNALITENAHSNFPLDIKLGSLTTNINEKTTFGSYSSNMLKVPLSGLNATKAGIYYNNVRQFRIVILKSRVNIIRLTLNYSYKLDLPPAYTYLVIQ